MERKLSVITTYRNQQQFKVLVCKTETEEWVLWTADEEFGEPFYGLS